MSTTVRRIRLITLISTLAMLAMPALATAQSASNDARSATTGDEYCLYPGKTTDTPETGPLPCDTSRTYMIGHRTLGGGSAPAAAESADQTDGSSASPSSADANSNRIPDVEAP
jgi:hypothetical protein